MSSSGEVYGMHIMPDRFNADILLPNGLFMTIPCKREDTLENVKRQLWKTISPSVAKYFNIGDQSSFIFSAVTYDAKLEEFYEESRRLCDLRLFDLMLRLVEPQGNKEEKRLSSMIDLAIGKKVNELLLELPRDVREEVNDFRKGNTDYEESQLGQLDSGSLFSSYSSLVDVPLKLRIGSATYVNVKNVDALFVRAAIYHGTECLGVQDTSQVEPSNPKWDQWLKFDFHCTDLPRSAKICLSICVISKKRAKEIFSLGTGNVSLFDYRGLMRSGRIQLNLWPPPKNSEDLLFPLGFLGSNPSHDSACLLLELLSFDRHVVFAPIHDVYAYAAHAIKQEPTIDSENIQIPNIHPASSSMSNHSSGSISNCHTHYSSIRLDFRDRTLSNSCADTRAFIERRLSSSSNNRRDSVSTTYNENLATIRSRRPTTNSEKFSAPSSRTSSTASFAASSAHNAVCSLIASGSTSTASVISVAEKASIAASAVTRTTPTPTVSSATPPASTAAATATTTATTNPPNGGSIPASGGSTPTTTTANEEQSIALVNELIATPPFTPLTCQQKTLLWNMRFYCKRVPESLPKLLDAIDWKSRNQLSQLYVLLDEWGDVSLETALRLLDTKYEDRYVRQHAVKWLDDCLDEEMLSCYLLQFVQVLKTEPYFENELSKFLNNRALLSPAIGNLFFWYLKSECDEVNDYYNTIRFRYLLERYLRSLPEDRLSILVRQVQGLDKLQNLAEALKDKTTKEERVKFMHSQLQRVDFSEMLQNIPDPTNHNRLLGRLQIDECRIMDSAKRPLWLVWSLPVLEKMITDATSAIIFKIGDDLRQDMLTLQIIRIVDAIWRHEGLDMCMLAYTCLATGKNVGIIEVVNKAETITSIQKSGGRMATIQIDSSQLHRWIKERNHDDYDEAIRKFTRSCAGYSVLTFVLGIADRNPDNIMVSEDGRIFHIDFGHFLGHFKKKFGINRERVPFVLTDDFLHVIARGSGVRKSSNFHTFRDLCGEAYVSLRRHSNLLITLFTMMLRTGIPELRTLDDISYLKTSLQVGVSEEKAREFFQAQFFEAYCGAWATKVDWFFHNIKRM